MIVMTIAVFPAARKRVFARKRRISFIFPLLYGFRHSAIDVDSRLFTFFRVFLRRFKSDFHEEPRAYR